MRAALRWAREEPSLVLLLEQEVPSLVLLLVREAPSLALRWAQEEPRWVQEALLLGQEVPL